MVCFSKKSSVVIKNGKFKRIKIKISDLKIGDNVLGFNRITGKSEFSDVIEILEHAEQMNVLNIICENGVNIILSQHHYLCFSEKKSNEFKDYVTLAAQNLNVGCFLLVKEGNYFVPAKVIEIRNEMDYVINPYTRNTTIIVNNVYASVFTSISKNYVFLLPNFSLNRESNKYSSFLKKFLKRKSKNKKK